MSSSDPESSQPSYLSKPGHWQVVHANDLERKYFESDDDVLSEPQTPDAKSLLSGMQTREEAVESSDADRTTNDGENAAPETSTVVVQRRQQLEQQIRSNPSDREPFLELGKIYRDEQRPIEAKRVLSQAIELFPDDADLKWEFEEATLAKSLQQLREVTELAGRLETAEADRELTRCQNDWAQQRMETCQARLERDPDLHHVRVALGEAMLDADMAEQAAKELEPLLLRDDYSPPAYLLRGKCFLAMKREVDAMVELRACAMRRSVPAPPRQRVLALRLLCDTAERLSLSLTLQRYREALREAEANLARQNAR